MMKTTLMMLFLLAVMGISKAQGLKFDSDRLPAGQTIKFSYDPKGTKLQGLAGITCNAYVFHSTTFPQVTTVGLTKQGGLYRGEVNVKDSATLVGLAFAVGEQFDEAKNGYLMPLTKDGKMRPETYLNLAFLFDRAGRSYLGLTTDASKSAAYYRQAFEIKPELRKIFAYEYLDLAYKGDKVSGTKLIQQDIISLANRKAPNEEEMALLIKLYQLLNLKNKSDSVKTSLFKKYPLGNYAFSAATNAIPRTFSAQETEAEYLRILAKFNIDTADRKNDKKLNPMNVYLTYLYSKTKFVSKFDYYASKMKNTVGAASFYHGYANFLMDKNMNVDSATFIAKKSLEMINKAKNSKERPVNFASSADYLKSLDITYGTYAHTYAKLLYLQGKNKEALVVKEKAMQLAPAPDQAVDYVTYLTEDGQYEKAFVLAEEIMKSGKATPALKLSFKKLYDVVKKGGAYEAYLADLAQQARLKELEEWKKRMVNIPAPAFSLVNLKGETVSLASLRGKIVILDYWATWCVPCLASFPGMQMAIDKYRSNPNIVFLFINTSQREDNRLKIVKDYMASTSYTFNVLLDQRDSRDVDKFEVRNRYNVSGIPAKFIIDAKGNIRFKMVGSSDVPEEILKELDMAISLISN
jgi:thiol-disulfide isomerase/thioredoxin